MTESISTVIVSAVVVYVYVPFPVGRGTAVMKFSKMVTSVVLSADGSDAEAAVSALEVLLQRDVY